MAASVLACHLIWESNLVTGLSKGGDQTYYINKARIDGQFQFGSSIYDDVRIYNRALSMEEVKALYDYEKP